MNVVKLQTEENNLIKARDTRLLNGFNRAKCLENYFSGIMYTVGYHKSQRSFHAAL